MLDQQVDALGASFHIGDFSVMPIDANGSVRAAAGFEILPESETSNKFRINLLENAPQDIYLRIEHDGSSRIDCSIEVASKFADEYLALAAAGSLPAAAYAGLARLGSFRGHPLPPGILATVSISNGAAQPTRQVVAVNSDPDSAPELLLSSPDQQQVVLEWAERNIGDYNNNGEVEIADITPIAIYFQQTVADAPTPEELELVDGDLNGEINLADLTPIARNFQTVIHGFSVYRATGEAPLPADFAPLGRPSVTRSEIWAATPENLRKQRLQYTATDQPGPDTHHYFVRSYANQDGAETEGPQSSLVSTDTVLGNLPPVWNDQVGIVSAVGIMEAVRLNFGEATDPEGGTVSYVVRYIEGFEPVGGPGTVEFVLPESVTVGDPPWEFVVDSLTAGQHYNLLLRAQDPEGNSTTNTAVTAVDLPEFRQSADPWANLHGNLQQTGSDASFSVAGPVEFSSIADLQLNDADRAYEIAISDDGWLVTADRNGAVRRYSLADGSLLGNSPAPAGPVAFRPAIEGNTLVTGTATGLAVYDLASGESPVEIDLGTEIAAAPLLLGDFAFTLGLDGSVSCINLPAGEIAWTESPGGSGAFSLAPCSDGESLFAANNHVTVFKLDLKTGELQQTGSTGSPPVGDSLALDAVNNVLYLATEDSCLLGLSGDNLTVKLDIPRSGENSELTEPCLALHASPPLAVAGYLPQILLQAPGRVAAYNLESGAEAWNVQLPSNLDWIEHISAGLDRLYCLGHDAIYIFDFDGLLRQVAAFDNSTVFSPCALADGSVAFTSDNGLYLGQAAVQDLAPVWQEHTGIESLTVGNGTITCHWTWAEDDHGAPVYYTLYVAENRPPEFNEPFAFTTAIKNIPDAHQFSGILGDNEYTLDGLQNAKRYYIGVRAHDRPWDSSPNFDTNINWLAATPPWQREEFLTGRELPAGEIFTLKGITAPDGSIHLVYNERVNGALRHVFNRSGTWEWEGPNLEAHLASAIDLDWTDDSLLIGVADIPTQNVGVIEREGPDVWNKTLISLTKAFVNPQIAFGTGDESALAYTHHIEGVFPPVLEGHYFISETLTEEWQSAEVLDDETYSGRDIDIAIDPADLLSPLCVFQRGWDYAEVLTPEFGELVFAVPDGIGGWALDVVDKGENFFRDGDETIYESDCGKRAVMQLDHSGSPHLTYLDLNSSPDAREGQLKYAYFDRGAWQIEVVNSFSNSFQGVLQHMWGELGFLLIDGQPLIATMQREITNRQSTIPSQARAKLHIREQSGEWREEWLTDNELIYSGYREPCVLLEQPDGTLHLFFVAVETVPDVSPTRLVHLWRPPV